MYWSKDQWSVWHSPLGDGLYARAKMGLQTGHGSSKRRQATIGHLSEFEAFCLYLTFGASGVSQSSLPMK